MTGHTETDGGGETSRNRGPLLRWGAIVTIGAVATIRCVVLIGPQIAFDIDPAVDPLPFAGVGPAVSLMLDVVLLLAAVAAMLGERMAGRGIDWWLAGLAALPLPAIAIHAAGDGGQFWRGSFWVAGIVAAVAAAHLARDRAARTALIALLLAAVVPLLVRAAVQVWHEHPPMVEMYDQNKDQMLAERGWDRDSPAALIYERRLRQPQPSAWFLSPNAFASLAAVGLVAFVGLAIAAVRGRLASGWWSGAAVTAAAAATGLWLTGSRGAIGAALLALAFLALPLLGPGRRLVARWGGAAALALVLLVPLGVVARGAILPEDFAGDRSLLFRWHYVQASARITVDHPLVGVGPDRFQEAYMSARNPRSPEEVTSAHSVWWDWLAMLGLGGIGWIALTCVLVYRSASPSPASVADDADDVDAGPSPVMLAAVTAVATIAGIVVEMHVLEQIGTLARVAGAIAGGAALLLALGILRRGDATWARWAVAAAAIAVLLHGQIELTFFEPGASVWAIVLLGVAGGARPGGRGGRAVAGVILTLALLTAAFGVRPAVLRETAQRRAAAVLEPVGRARWNMLFAMQTQDVGPFRHALALVDASLRDLGLDDPAIQDLRLQETADAAAPLTQPQVDLFRTLLEPREAERRVEAAEILLAASPADHPDPHLVDAAVTQYLEAALKSPERVTILRRAATAADEAADASGRAPLLVTAIGPHVALAASTRDQAERRKALDYALALAEIDPHGNQTWKRVGDLAVLSQDMPLALDAYRRALVADDQFELDPLACFSTRDRAAIESRVQQLQAIPNDVAPEPDAP